ncbi:hypothetical protein A3L04_01965 [Thermococcus chitonophagus]|uniref:Integral membrane protein n=1 Tax=Thermococcus chitonophagus TaxID=54262 RepID=A0A160VRF5_9EURY|nr:flippase-like domain-containing protein [Thermococcus chitonophagus]ASJ15926.1 hypothetical protein A3L04_01965 [Thermococcus chitonophagus]CUX77169.1 hypothetical protein CHITON_0390 [Thermococcus chitonophagus]
MNVKKYVTLVIGVLIILLLLWWAGLRETIMLMLRADLRYLLLAVMMYCITVLSWAIRWRIFLNGVGVKASFVRILEGVFVGIFLNNLTPGARTGGEAIKALYIAKSSNGTYPRVFATVMADRILDVVPVIIFMTIAFVYAVGHGITILIWVLALSTILLVLVVLLTLLFSIREKYALGLVMRLFGLFKRLFPGRLSKYEGKIEGKLRGALGEFKSTLVLIAKRKRDVMVSMFWSFVLWMADVVRMYFVFLSLGKKVSVIQVLLVKMASMAVAMVSVIPGGVGISETVQSALFLAVGVEKALAVSATVLDRLISFWAPTLIGGILVLKRRDVLRLDKLPSK